jgi:hypothetical protein
MAIFVINTNPSSPQGRPPGVRYPWMASLAAELIDFGITWSDTRHDQELTNAHGFLAELGGNTEHEIITVDVGDLDEVSEVILAHNMSNEEQD